MLPIIIVVVWALFGVSCSDDSNSRVRGYSSSPEISRASGESENEEYDFTGYSDEYLEFTLEMLKRKQMGEYMPDEYGFNALSEQEVDTAIRVIEVELARRGKGVIA